MLLEDVFKELTLNLKEGYDCLRRMRGADKLGFNYSMLENSLEVNQRDFHRCVQENFEKSLIDEAKEYCRNKGYHEYSIEFVKELHDVYMKKRVQPVRCFVDMDGVLYRFDNTLNSIEPLYEEGYFRNLAPMKLAHKAIHKLMEKYPNQIYVLTHVLDSPYAEEEKIASLKEDFPTLDKYHIIMVPYGENKADYVPMQIQSNDILIDDYNHNLENWKERGGYPVKFVNDINDRRGTWKGSRIEYDDPDLFEELTKLVQEQKQLEGLDEKAETIFKERIKDIERIKI